jgi:hypothetical protein
VPSSSHGVDSRGVGRDRLVPRSPAYNPYHQSQRFKTCTRCNRAKLHGPRGVLHPPLSMPVGWREEGGVPLLSAPLFHPPRLPRPAAVAVWRHLQQMRIRQMRIRKAVGGRWPSRAAWFWRATGFPPELTPVAFARSSGWLEGMRAERREQRLAPVPAAQWLSLRRTLQPEPARR